LAGPVLLKVTYLLMRWTFGLAVLMLRGDQAKNAELLVLRHENAVLRRHTGRVRYEAADLAWFTALTRFIPRQHRAGVFQVTPATLLAWAPQARRQEVRDKQAAPAWPPGDDPRHRPARRPPGEREPAVGIPAYSWLAQQAGRDGRAVHCLRDPCAPRVSIPHRAGTARPGGSSGARRRPGSWPSTFFTSIPSC
jgi:hypothetical protein